MSRFALSLTVWGSWIGLFLILELLPLFWKSCPWEMLSNTVWDIENIWHLFKFCVGVFLLALALHFLWKVPAAFLITAAVGTAVAAILHFAIRVL